MQHTSALILACSMVVSSPGFVLGSEPDAPREPVVDQASGLDIGFANAEAMLDALETADRDIKTFHAQIIYDRFFMLQNDRHTRGGDLYFQVERVPGVERPFRTFAVHFQWLQLDGAKREERKAWMFNGEWLVEKSFADKRYHARQIAKPGQQVDPLRLGEGPLPIPIGQRKSDILARYTAEILPTLDGLDPENEDQAGYARVVADAQATQLHLTPLPHRIKQDDLRSIRLWYQHDDEGRLLPVLSRTIDRKGDESFVLLANVLVNGEIPGDVIDINPPPAGQGWDVQKEPWRGDHDRGNDGENGDRVSDQRGEVETDED